MATLSHDINTNGAIAPSAPKEGSVLFVDDDRRILALLKRLFQESFEVKIAESGMDALKILHGGFTPQVIFADQCMPVMNGTEFLAKSREVAPDAVRVILTAHTDVQTIIASINKGNIYKFVTKPWMDEDIFQTVRNCIEHHTISSQNKRLFKELQIQYKNLQQRNSALALLNTKIKENLLQGVRVLTSLVSANERYYYTHHAQTVAVMVRALAVRMEIAEENLATLVIAALLHDIGKIGLHESCLFPQPDEAESVENLLYQSHVAKSVKHISSIGGLEKAAEIIMQHHERYDGTGFPAGLKDKEILIEAQILSICDMYHNSVYRISPDEFEGKTLLYEPVQEKAELTRRQSEAISQIHRKAGWFHPDVVQAFYKLAQSGKCPPLQTGFSGFDNEVENVLKSAKYTTSTKTEKDDKTDRRIRTIHIPEIRIGMIVAQDIHASNGTLVIAKGTAMDHSKLSILKSYFQQKLIATHLTFYDF